VKAIYATSALLFIFANAAAASEFGCPHCQSEGTCVLKAEQVEEDETCYDVECKEICIPAVRFPWESCRTPKCGRVRVVSKLKEDKRKATTCKYEWVLTCPRCGRPASVPKEGENESSSTMKPADRTPPVPPTAPTSPAPPMAPIAPSAPPATMGWRKHVPHESAAKPEAVGVATYMIRSRTR
jgi:hypothetical protein